MTLERLRQAVPSRVWVPAGLAVLAALLLRHFLFGGAVFYKRDVHLVWHPQVEAFVRAVAAGSWPLWDPSPGFGQPLLADPSAQILYPFTWLNLVLMPWTYYTVFVAVHAWLSGCGMAALASRHGLSPLTALVAGALWMTSGPLVSMFDLWHHFTGACWIPWVVLAAERAFTSRRAIDGVPLGVAAGLQLLAGSADMVMATALLVGVELAAFHWSWRRPWRPENRRVLAVAAMAAAIAAGLSAGLWLTALAASWGTERWALSDAIRTYWSVHPAGMLEVVFPQLLTSLPLEPAWHAALTESREPFLWSLYLGVGTLALAAFAVGRQGQGRRVHLLLAVAMLALLIALGRHAPFYSAAVALLPPLKVLRYPVKAMVVVAFTLCLAAGHGTERWRRGEVVPGRTLAGAFLGVVVATLAIVLAAARFFPSHVGRHLLHPATPDPNAVLVHAAGRLSLTAMAAFLLLGLVWSRRAGANAAVVAAAVAVADLAAAHRHVNPMAPVMFYRLRPEVVDLLRQTPLARAYVYDYTIRDRAPSSDAAQRSFPPLRPTPGRSLASTGALSQQMALVPATAGRWGIDTGWTVDARGLYPSALAALGGLILKQEGADLQRLLRMGAVTHVLAFHQEGFETLAPAAEVPGEWERPLRLYTVPGTLSRTYVIANVRTAATARDALQHILSPAFDPAQEVVLEGVAAEPSRAGAVGTCRIVERQPDRVVLEADLSAPGYVVLVDGFSEGWRANVSGRAAPILRANAFFRAIAVPEGRHRIEMVYRPPAALAGLALSGATAVGCAGALAASHRRRRESAS